MSLDDVLRDPFISPSLRDALRENHRVHEYIPPRHRWPIIFGPEPASSFHENRWMVM